MPGWLQTLLVALTVGSGVIAGVFLAFSAVVMPALRRLPPAEAVRAMQAVNVSAVTPVFMTALFGTAALAVVVGVWTVTHRAYPAVGWIVTGAATYLVAAVVVTIAANVPRNDRLAALDADNAGSGWADFLAGWVPWNHVRTIGCVVACVLLVVAVRVVSGTTANSAQAAAVQLAGQQHAEGEAVLTGRRAGNCAETTQEGHGQDGVLAISQFAL